MTRYFALVDYSLNTSAMLWEALPIKDRDSATLQRQFGTSKFACPGGNVLPVLQDRHTLCSLLTLSSYALVEAHVDDVITYMVSKGSVGVQLVDDVRAGKTTVRGFVGSGGIEVWGTTLLNQLGRSWADVFDGLGGAVEVATVRNALAHANRTVGQSMINRVQQSGGGLPWPLGAEIALDLERARVYRDRLRSFARVTDMAAVQYPP